MYERRLRTLMGAAVCFGALAVTLGCDGMVGVEGWAVEAQPGEPSEIVMGAERPDLDDPPEGLIQKAWMELRIARDGELLERSETTYGLCGAGHIGLYAPGDRYIIKAGAKGYQTATLEVELPRATTSYVRVRLAPKKAEEALPAP